VGWLRIYGKHKNSEPMGGIDKHTGEMD
jgi:hypothetical protein